MVESRRSRIRRWTATVLVLLLAGLAGALVEYVVERTTAPSATAALAGLSWTQVSLPTNQFDTLRTVIAAGPGFIVGGASDVGPSIWVSSDGRRWDAVRDASVDSVQINALVTFRGLVLAGGRGQLGKLDTAAVWSSRDGRHWSQTALPRVGSPGFNTQTVTAMAAGPSGLVAVGYELDKGFLQPLLWHSPDGTSWTLIDLGAIITPANARDARRTGLDSVTASPWGYEAMGGPTNTQTNVVMPLDHLLLWSPDGERWSQVPAADAAFGAVPPGNTCGPTGLASDQGRPLAVGVQDRLPSGSGYPAGRQAVPALWTSDDGQRWTRLNPASGGAEPECQWSGSVVALVRLDDWLIATGGIRVAPLSATTEAAVWASDDAGLHWTAMPQVPDLLNPGGVQPVIRSMAVRARDLVAVGMGEQGGALAWHATPMPVIGRDPVSGGS